jgi:hypothetical protein
LRLIHSLLSANSKNAFTRLMFFTPVIGLTSHDLPELANADPSPLLD